jgi:hypothetical protein
MDSSQLRRWVDDKRAVERRERDEARSQPVSCSESIARALALIALYGRLHGWPVPEDGVSRREDSAAYEHWHRLKTRLRQAR